MEKTLENHNLSLFSAIFFKLILLSLMSLITFSKDMTLEGDQFCSYRQKAEIFDLFSSDKLELEKGYECEVCSAQKECKTFKDKLLVIPHPEEALTGRIKSMQISDSHFVLGTKMKQPFPANLEIAIFGMGCF